MDAQPVRIHGHDRHMVAAKVMVPVGFCIDRKTRTFIPSPGSNPSQGGVQAFAFHVHPVRIGEGIIPEVSQDNLGLRLHKPALFVLFLVAIFGPEGKARTVRLTVNESAKTGITKFIFIP